MYYYLQANQLIEDECLTNYLKQILVVTLNVHFQNVLITRLMQRSRPHEY